MIKTGLLTENDLKALLLIRNFEKLLLKLFSQGSVRGTTHTCLGQEYIPVALNACLHKADFILSNHRCHGHYLARFKDARGLLAEILGKEGAICKGVGGSQHIFREGFLSTGIQGENVGVSLGIGLHFKHNTAEDMVIVYMGDGTWGQGIVYESLNVMALLSLPIVLVVENNGIAQSTPIEKNMAGTIADRVKAFGIDYVQVKGCDIEKIREAISPMFNEARRKRQPLVIEFMTNRLGPHSASKDSRSDDELAVLQQSDWYEKFKKEEPDNLKKIEIAVIEEIERIQLEISQAPLIR